MVNFTEKKIKNMQYLEVVNLNKYQSQGKTKDWIKIWKKILNDFKFCQLSNGERWIFIGLMILAVDHNNTLPKDSYWVYQRVAKGEPKGRYRVDIGIKNMLKLGLLRVKTDTQIREDKIIEKNVSSKKKPYYKDNGKPMYRDPNGKWFVIMGQGDFREFAGDIKKDIIWK